jgi:hypothetical protein
MIITALMPIVCFMAKTLSLKAVSSSRQLLIIVPSRNTNYCPIEQLKFNGFTLYCPPFLFHCLNVKVSGVTILKQHICLPILFVMHKQNTNWFLLCSWSSSPKKKKVTISFLSTWDQLAYLFTKLLVVARFRLSCNNLHVQELPFNLEG